MKEITLWGTGLRSRSASVCAEDRINCYYDIRKSPDGSKIAVRGTPGSSRWVALPQSPVRGLHTIGALLYVVAGNGLYSVTSTGIITRLGTLGTSSNRVGMSDNAIQLIIVDGAAGYILTLATSVMASIADAHFPNGATTVAFLKSVFIVEAPNTTRQFYVSAALDGTNWTYLSTLPIYATKESNNDPLYSVYAFNSVLFLFGTQSTELWQDAGLSPEPFQLITGGVQPYGLAARASVAQVGTSIMYLASGTQGGYVVMSSQGGTPGRVSSPDCEDLLTQWAATGTLGDAIGLSYTIDGHDMYMLTFPTANRSIFYDTTTSMWNFAQTGIAVGRHYAAYSTVYSGGLVFSDSTSANLYIMSATAYSDDSNPILRQVTTKHMRSNGNKFAVADLALMLDTGSAPVGQAYNITLEVSRDQGNTFGSPRNKSVGAVGQYGSPRVNWARLGSAKDFVFRFKTTDPVPFAIASAEISTIAAS